MAKFPSVEWFDEVRALVNADDEYRRLGTVDSKVGIKSGDTLLELTFEAFECTGVREIEENDLLDVDFWLEQSPEAWQAMIEDIKANGAAGLGQTLNTIDLNITEGFARSHDGYRRDSLYRFNHILQLFFDTSAKIDTEFAVGATS